MRRAEEILEQTLREHYEEVRAADDFETELANELDELGDFVIGRDTRTYCILMASFLEDTLQRTFCRQWKVSSRKSRDDFFGSNGPLSTFSQRVLVATALGWLSEKPSGEARTLRKIRNELAHNHKVHILTEPPLHDLATSLAPRETTFVSLPGYEEALGGATLETRLRLRVFSSAALIAGQILFRAKMHRHGLGPLKRDSGYDALTGVEQRVIDVTVRHCFSTLSYTESEE